MENKFLRLKNAHELFLWLIMLFIKDIVSLQIIVTLQCKWICFLQKIK